MSQYGRLYLFGVEYTWEWPSGCLLGHGLAVPKANMARSLHMLDCPISRLAKSALQGLQCNGYPCPSDIIHHVLAKSAVQWLPLPVRRTWVPDGVLMNLGRNVRKRIWSWQMQMLWGLLEVLALLQMWWRCAKCFHCCRCYEVCSKCFHCCRCYEVCAKCFHCWYDDVNDFIKIMKKKYSLSERFHLNSFDIIV